MKPERLRPQTEMSTEEHLLSVNVSRHSNQLSPDVGFIYKARSILKKKDSVQQSAFRSTALQAYQAGARFLQMELPLQNQFLQAAGGLNPDLDSCKALGKLLKLPSPFPGVLSSRE